MTPCDFCHCSDASRLTLHQIGGVPSATLTLCQRQGDRGGCIDHVGHWDLHRRLGFLAMLRAVDLDAFEREAGRAVDRGLVAFWRTVLGRAERAVNPKRGEEE